MKKKLQQFSNFRKNCRFQILPIEEKNGQQFFMGQLVEDENKKYSEGEGFLNIGYNFKNSSAKILSNLYPMSFIFRGKRVNSIEGVLQGIKYKDKKTQNLVLKYSGTDAYHTRAANSLDFWGNNMLLYWQGKEMNRDGKEYQLFLDELYLSVSKNPLYRRALLATGDKYLLHHIGKESSAETVLTREEFECRLYAIREYLKFQGDKIK